MKNKEKFLDELLEMVTETEGLAVSMEIHEPDYCRNVPCSECIFHYMDANCIEGRKQWLEEEYNEWENTEVDTRILVRDKECNPWEHRHFHKYEKGKVYAFVGGRTSFTVDGYPNISNPWKHAKLYNEESEE